MRFLLMVLTLAFILPEDTQATAKAAKMAARKPAAEGAGPSRVITFVCRNYRGSERPITPENVVGIAFLTVSLSDARSGSFSSFVYIRIGASYSSKTITGNFSSVPRGYRLATQWSPEATQSWIELHPEEATIFPAVDSTWPGLNAPQRCLITGQLLSS